MTTVEVVPTLRSETRSPRFLTSFSRALLEDQSTVELCDALQSCRADRGLQYSKTSQSPRMLAVRGVNTGAPVADCGVVQRGNYLSLSAEEVIFDGTALLCSIFALRHSFLSEFSTKTNGKL